jgi:predicted NBD/HSP70 family sugar kinase
VKFDRPKTAAARSDQTTVRHSNLGVVLQHLAAKGPRSRARIADETGLTRATVSSLVSELIELELVREAGEEKSSGRVGRPSVTLELHDRVVAVGLEVNVDYLAYCVEGLTGTVWQEKRVFVENRRSSARPVLDRLARVARQAFDFVEQEGLVPVGIGVAVPGIVSAESGTLLRAPNLGWSRIHIADELCARLGHVPIRVENEANAAAVAEHWQGAAVGVRSFLSVFGEVGVGAGIFIDGELFRGAHGFGGEFGHINVDPEGLPCACGSRGCLETLVGQEAIARNAGIVFGRRARSVTDELVRRAEAGEKGVLRALREAGESLGIALASAVNLFDVQAIVLGGCYGPLSPWLEDSVRSMLQTRVLSAEWSECELRASGIGEAAAARGAAALMLRAALAEPWAVAGRREAMLRAVS